MSIAYLDPGNIESDLQVGAVAQYKVGHVINIQDADLSSIISFMCARWTWPYQSYMYIRLMSPQ